MDILNLTKLEIICELLENDRNHRNCFQKIFEELNHIWNSDLEGANLKAYLIKIEKIIVEHLKKESC